MISPALHSRAVVLVDEHGLDDHQDLVHKRAHQLVQLVQDAVNHLHSDTVTQ